MQFGREWRVSRSVPPRSFFALPWVPEVFLACGGNLRCWPKADTSSAVGRSREKNAGHYKDLTEIGNRARKVSGTQGIFAPKSHRNACFASYRGTDYVQQKKQYNQSIKLSGELLLSGSFISFVMTVPTERRKKLLLWNLYDYKKATRGDWFLPTYFWRFAI